MISVIVLNYNGKQYLETCLASIFSQTIAPFEYEVLLVDNGSTDGSKEYIKSSFPNVKLIELEKNTGFSVANNIAVDKAQGEYVILLNNDTEVDKNWLAELKSAIERHPEAAAFASKMMFFEKRDIIDSAGDDFSPYGFGIKRGFGGKDSEVYSKEEKIFGPCGGAAVYKKDVYKSIGGLDEDFFAYCEDVDFNFRMKMYGYDSYFVPKALVFHKRSGTFGQLSDDHTYFTQRNQEYVLYKNSDPKTIFLHSIYNIYSFFKHLFRGKAKVFLKAKADAAANKEKMLEKRRWIFAKKKFVVKKTEVDTVLVKFEKSGYSHFFVKKESKSNIINYLEKKGLKNKIYKRNDELLQGDLVSSYQLIELGKVYYLTEEAGFKERFIRELPRFLSQLKNDSDLINIIISFGYFKDAGIPHDLSRNFLSLLSGYVSNKIGTSEDIIERTVLHLISSFLPFIYNAPEHDAINWFLSKIGHNGFVGMDNKENNLLFVEMFSINVCLSRLKKKTVDFELIKAVRPVIEFIFNSTNTDGSFNPRFINEGLLNKKANVEYVKYLKALIENDRYSGEANEFIIEYIFFGGEFSLEEEDLKPAPFKPDLISAGYAKDFLYIMRGDNGLVLNDIFTFSFFKNRQYLLIDTKVKPFDLDGGLINYNKNLETNIWVAGKEYDFLDIDYDITPSVRHKIQYYFNKKNSYMVLRHKFVGTEKHNVKINFFFNKILQVDKLTGGFDKQLVRDTITKFTKANKLEPAYLKLNGEEAFGAVINNGEYFILPLNNPGININIENSTVTYSVDLTFPNDLVFLIY